MASDALSEARELAQWMAARTGAPMSICLRFASGVRDIAAGKVPRNAMAQVLGLRLLGETIMKCARDADVIPGEVAKPPSLSYELKEPPKADAV